MSAWERARNIPWDRMPQDGSNLDEQKERIFRELQRETIEEELMLQERNRQTVSEGEEQEGAKKFQTKVPYSNMQALRQFAFGATIGSVTGTMFGFMDGMRQAAESTTLAKASNAAKGKFIFQGTSRSAFLFGGFFGGFQVVKYGIMVLFEPGEIAEIVGAGALSLGALAYKPAYRASMPYAAMLVIMDGAQLYMRKTGG